MTQLTEKEILERVAELKKLVQEDKSLEGLQSDDLYLRRFLIGTGYDVQAAYEKMKTFYELLLEVPDWFTREGPRDKKHIIDEESRFIIPGEDKEGRPIYVIRFANVDTRKMNMYDCIAVDDIMLEHLYQDPKIANGLSVIMDVSNLPWKLVKWMTPFNIKTGLKKLETIPINHFRFHVVNSSMMVNTCIKIVWPFMSDRFKEMVKFHFNDLTSLHDHIDQETLPMEYGGFRKFEMEKLLQPIYERHQEIEDSFRARRATFVGK